MYYNNCSIVIVYLIIFELYLNIFSFSEGLKAAHQSKGRVQPFFFFFFKNVTVLNNI